MVDRSFVFVSRLLLTHFEFTGWNLDERYSIVVVGENISPIEIESEGNPYCWIFYTKRFFLFDRALSPELTFRDYKIRNKSVIYARRVEKVETD